MTHFKNYTVLELEALFSVHKFFGEVWQLCRSACENNRVVEKNQGSCGGMLIGKLS